MTTRPLIPAVLLTLGALAGCGSSGGDTETSAADVTYGSPVWGDENVAVVEVETTEQSDVQAAVEDAVNDIDETKGDGGWFIYAVCSTGGTEAEPNLVGTARFAKGDDGVKQTGISEGEYEFEFAPAASCP